MHQNVSVIINNSAKIMNLKCKILNDDFELISNSSKLEKASFNFKSGLNSDFCCQNISHYLTLFGQCKNIYDSDHLLATHIMTLKSKQCGLTFHYRFSTFVKLNDRCIAQIFTFKHCFSSKILKCDEDNFSCNKQS